MTITANPMPVPMVGVKRLGDSAYGYGPYAPEYGARRTQPDVQSRASRRMGAAGPRLLPPSHEFAPPVVYGAYNFQAYGMGCAPRLGAAQGGPYPVLYGGRGVQMRLGHAGRPFAPSILYGSYAHQAYGFGRHRPVRRGHGVGGYPSRMSGYARMGAQAVPKRVAYMATRLGDTNPFSGIINAAENLAGGLPINAPEAGGGYVVTSVNSDNSTSLNYTDSSGGMSQMTVPPQANGQPATGDQLVGAVAATGAGTTPPIIPSSISPWLWGAGAIVGAVLLFKVLK